MEIKYYRGDPIKKLENFISFLDLEDDYEAFISSNSSSRYREPVKSAYKSDGSKRRVLCPNKLTRKFQRRINNRFFKPKIIWPEFVYGSIPKLINGIEDSRDHIKCAEKHCGAKSLLKMDISDFFDNIHKEHIKDILVNTLDLSNEVADFICDVCCFENTLVQGALTSSYVANLIFFDLEHLLVKRLERKGLTYTRFIDDISVSSKASNFNFNTAKKLIEDMLLQKDLPINEQKEEVSYSSIKPLMVHGLRVEFDQPRLPAKEIAKIRAEVHALTKKAQENNFRKSRSYRRSFDRCLGRIHKLARVKHPKHGYLKNALSDIQPLPSAVDIKHCFFIIKKLETYPDSYREKYWYKKRFNLVVYMNGIIKRLYKDKYTEISERLKEIEPKDRKYDIG